MLFTFVPLNYIFTFLATIQCGNFSRLLFLFTTFSLRHASHPSFFLLFTRAPSLFTLTDFFTSYRSEFPFTWLAKFSRSIILILFWRGSLSFSIIMIIISSCISINLSFFLHGLRKLNSLTFFYIYFFLSFEILHPHLSKYCTLTITPLTKSINTYPQNDNEHHHSHHYPH